ELPRPKLLHSNPGEAEGVVYLQEWSIYSPQRWAKNLDGHLCHQVAAEKWLECHDEQLMLIIPVVGRYNMQGYYDR
ncbi:hypothetical protein A2U01_0044219, partial [Trifolium medium]|nr:hypothetical protein [Trifolium medium]